MEVPANNQDRNKRRKNHHRRKKPEPEPEPEAEVDYSGMKKAELVELCLEKGLAKSGTKDVLIERLSSFKEATMPSQIQTM